jgi:hypothetical protein
LKKNKNLLPADLFDEFSHDVDRQPDRFVRKIKKGAPVNRTGRYPKNQKALVRE